MLSQRKRQLYCLFLLEKDLIAGIGFGAEDFGCEWTLTSETSVCTDLALSMTLAQSYVRAVHVSLLIDYSRSHVFSVQIQVLQ